MSGTSTVNFTISAIEKLPYPQKGYTTYKDEKNTNLRLYVTSKGVKTFFIRKRVLGKQERIIIGSYPVFSVEKARKEALILSGIVASGKDPRAEKKAERQNNQTFGEHFKNYIERYSKLYKNTWREDEREINKYVSHWFRYRLSAIKKDDVQKLIEKIHKENGLYQANKILIRIRTIFNKAIEWDWQGKNPTQGIKKFKEKSRDRFIQPVEMPFIIRAINEEEDKTTRDFLYILLLTGVRKTNALMMKWTEIDWEKSQWRIPITKNGEPLTVPLVERALEILKTRFETTISEWVFDHKSDNKKNFQAPQSAWETIRKRATVYRWLENERLNSLTIERFDCLDEHTAKEKLKIIKELAESEKIILPKDLLDIRMHDIRRTFGSFQAITGASIHIIGKSLGHKSSQVTEVYARLNIDPIRESMEKGTQAMFGEVVSY